MIEAYAFLAAFAIQILVMSVLLPTWFIRNARVKTARFPAERLAQLYPGVDLVHAQERFLTQYRVLNTGIAILALLLLAWLSSNAWRADWREVGIGFLATGYFIVAIGLPNILYGRSMTKFNKKYRLAEGKQTAVLQRRGLFDFVSPFVVFLAVLGYFLFAAFLIYVEQHPFPGFAGPFINIAAVTLIYAVNAFVVYIVLYGKKGPLETHADRLNTIGLAVKGTVYSCIAIVAALSINFSLRLLDLTSWDPVAGCIFWATLAIFASMGFAAPLRKSEADGLGESPVS